MKILIVEDEIRIREGITKLLGKLDKGYEIVGEAVDGEQGLDLCKKLIPDLIITDIKMPNMDGLEMLYAIDELGIKVKAIVLSAYSEFEYARKAMNLGVTEYLLKPISLMDFSKALDNIAEQIAEDMKKKPAQVGTLEQVFRDIIFGYTTISDDTAEYLKKAYGIDKQQNFFVICAYMGNAFEEKRHDGYKFLKHFFSLYSNFSYVLLESEYLKSVVMIAYSYKNAHDIELFLQHQMLKQVDEEIVIGCVESQGLNNLKNCLDALYPFMDWNISFGEGIIISYPQITNVQTSVCIYPIELEDQIKSAIFTFDETKLKKTIQEFHESFMDGKIYNPRELKECYVRFLWIIMEVGKESGCIKAESIKRQKLLDKIMNSKTHQELNSICEDVLSKFDFKKDQTTSNHLVIRKAENLIHEFYNTGITLDEIAAKLNITPEYLGTQFHKETGMTYSTYMKNYRISKAKELLVSTNLKLYEIAEQVGYHDSKYFSKVFREVTGQLPAEYRRTI